MDARHTQARKIYQALCDLDPAEQASRLDEECGDDSGLRAEVQLLLAHHGEPPTSTLGPALPRSGEPDVQPKHIGQYRVIREIGRGGMGVVYLGVREDDQFTRQAAIKVLKRGMDTADILRRFDRERQLLAALNHPGIARLYDGGQTEDGLPYFAMEFVAGQPIHDYCDTHRLRIGERLKLFQQVCSAVHYAHQNLVVHRDLKPGNIIVGNDGVPKLLDFGIAKLINPGMSLFAGDPTAPDLRLMTPEYASPEQVRGDPITTASDIYSLGVLLFELVTGHRPYRLRSRVEAEIRRVVCEVDPEKPSTAVSWIEEVQATEGDPSTGTTTITPELVSKVREGRPDRLRRRLAGDIDNIVLMAMRKEPQRRYGSVEQFAADIGRHLDGMPVIACRDTAGYRISKFVRRHRGGVAAAAVIVLLLLGGIGMTSWQADIARTQRDRAETMFGQVLNLAHVFIFDFHDRIAPLDGSLPARELLVTTALECLDGLAEHVGDDLDLRRVLASSYDKLGEIRGGIRNPALGRSLDALESYAKGIQMRQSLLDRLPEDLELRRQMALSHMHMGDILAGTGRMAQARAEYDTSLAITEELAEADAVYRRALAIDLVNIGKVQYRFGRHDEALTSYERSLGLRRDLAAANPDTPRLQRDVSVALIRVAALRAEAGLDEQALDRFTEAITIRERLAAAHPDNGRYRRDLGIACYYTADFLLSRDQVDRAADHALRFFDIARRRVADNPSDARSKLDLAVACEIVGRIRLFNDDPDAALSAFQEFKTVVVALSEADPANTQYRRRVADSHRRISEVRAAQGDTAGALRGYQRALDIMTTMLHDDPDDTILQGDRAELLKVIDALGASKVQDVQRSRP